MMNSKGVGNSEMAKKNIMYIDPSFRLELDNLKQKYKKEKGIDLSYAQCTRIAANIIREKGFNGILEEDYDRHKRKRRLVFEL